MGPSINYVSKSFSFLTNETVTKHRIWWLVLELLQIKIGVPVSYDWIILSIGLFTNFDVFIINHYLFRLGTPAFLLLFLNQCTGVALVLVCSRKVYWSGTYLDSASQPKKKKIWEILKSWNEFSSKQIRAERSLRNGESRNNIPTPTSLCHEKNNLFWLSS